MAYIFMISVEPISRYGAVGVTADLGGKKAVTALPGSISHNWSMLHQVELARIMDIGNWHGLPYTLRRIHNAEWESQLVQIGVSTDVMR